MSVFFRVPPKSIFHQTHNSFVANFNSPVLGKYSFDSVLNQDKEVIELQPDSVYLIDRITVGATIDENVYLNSVVVFPRIRLRKLLNKQNLLPNDYVIDNYARNSDFVVFVASQTNTEKMLMTVTGLLDQIPDTVGVLSITLNISLSIYKISSTDYNEWFIGGQANQKRDFGR